MKKILFAVAMVAVLVSTVSAQTPSLLQSTASADVWAIRSWVAFSGDSTAVVYSNTFGVADYDSVYVWCKATSVNGKPNFRVTLMGGFEQPATRATSTNSDSLGAGAQADTTSVKLETLKYLGKSATFGATWARVKLSPSIFATYGGTTYNRADGIINIYLVGVKRQLVNSLR